MTKKELLKIEHLAINQEEKDLFHHVHVEDGYMLTSWDENEDIEEYQGFECIYMPIGNEYVDFHVITKEKHNFLNALAEKMRNIKENED